MKPVDLFFGAGDNARTVRGEANMTEYDPLEMTDEDLEFLMEQHEYEDEDDGQPDELTERLDFNPDC
jgi:hypothetical protein